MCSAAAQSCTAAPRTARTDLPDDATCAWFARKWAASILDTWGTVADDVGVVLSELVTNALLHTGAPRSATLLLYTDGHGLRLEVIDLAPQKIPVQRRPCADAVDGRGMMLVDALTESWGVDIGPDDKIVWAEFALAA